MRLPATPEQHPLENQCTAVLAWLVDRSDLFAREFVALFLDDPVPAGTVGARAQLSLPMPDGSTLRPDLSVDGPNGSLQLLVEVKVASVLATYETPDGTVRRQDRQYAWGWSRLEQPDRRVRAVGTLTLEPPDQQDADPAGLRARHATWFQVRDLLHRLLPEMGEQVRLVASSFLEVLSTRVAVTPPDPARLAAWLDEHVAVAITVARQLAAGLSAAKTTKAGGAQFAGRRVHIPGVHGQELRLRVYVTPAGGAQNAPGLPDALIVGLERDSGGTIEPDLQPILTAAGFPRLRDKAGDVMHRMTWPLRDAATDPDEITAAVLAALAGPLTHSAAPMPSISDTARRGS
jgi:hypothetical protein